MGDINGYHGFRKIGREKQLGWYIQPALVPPEIKEIIEALEASEHPNEKLIQFLKEVLAVVG